MAEVVKKGPNCDQQFVHSRDVAYMTRYGYMMIQFQKSIFEYRKQCWKSKYRKSESLLICLHLFEFGIGWKEF